MAKNLSSPLTAAFVAVIVSSVVMAAGLTFADHDAACGGVVSMPSSPPSGQWYECNTTSAQWELRGTPTAEGGSTGCTSTMPSIPQQNLPAGQWYECVNNVWELRGTPTPSGSCSSEPSWPDCAEKTCTSGAWTCTRMNNTTSGGSGGGCSSPYPMGGPYSCDGGVFKCYGSNIPDSSRAWEYTCTPSGWTKGTVSGGVCPEFTMYRGCIESCMSRGSAMSCPMCGAECSSNGGGTGDPATCTACITAGGTRLTCPTCPGYTGGGSTGYGGDYGGWDTGMMNRHNCYQPAMVNGVQKEVFCRDFDANCFDGGPTGKTISPSEIRFTGGPRTCEDWGSQTGGGYGGSYGGTTGGIWGGSGGGGTMGGGGNATCVADCVATTPGMCTEPIAPGKRSVCDFKRSRNWSGTACEEFCNGIVSSSRSSSSTRSSVKSGGPTVKECGPPPVFGKEVLNLRCVNGEWAWDQDDRQKPPEDICKIYPEKCKKTEPKPGDGTILAQLEALEQEIAMTEEKIDALDDQVDVLQEKLQTLKEQKAKKTEINKVKKEGKKLVKQQRKLQQKLNRLNQKYDALSRQASPSPRPISF